MAVAVDEGADLTASPAKEPSLHFSTKGNSMSTLARYQRDTASPQMDAYGRYALSTQVDFHTGSEADLKPEQQLTDIRIVTQNVRGFPLKYR